MEPTFQDGDVVWVNSWVFFLTRPKIGELVIVDWQDKKLLKRIKNIEGDLVEVSGDNINDSLSSDKIGKVRIKDIVGKVFQ
jgi:signal peptidase I